jgi:hypothetical protein
MEAHFPFFFPFSQFVQVILKTYTIDIRCYSKKYDGIISEHFLEMVRTLHFSGRGKTNIWIQSVLRDRNQSVLVVVEGETSNSIPVESGVPQGSVLRPPLIP